MGSGTRAQFISWLSDKGMTYRRYSRLATEAKVTLYVEYLKTGAAGQKRHTVAV